MWFLASAGWVLLLLLLLLRCFAAGGRLLPVAAGLLALVGYYTAG